MRLDHLLSKEQIPVEILEGEMSLWMVRRWTGLARTSRISFRSIWRACLLFSSQRLSLESVLWQLHRDKAIGKLNAKQEAFSRTEKARKVKIIRAYGGCLGAKSRRRTWLTAKSFGES